MSSINKANSNSVVKYVEKFISRKNSISNTPEGSRVWKFWVEALDPESVGELLPKGEKDAGFTLLNEDRDCNPYYSSFDSDSDIYALEHEVKLETGVRTGNNPSSCVFKLNQATGQITVVLKKGVNDEPWLRVARNGKTFAENTRAFLKKYIVGIADMKRFSASGGALKTKSNRKNKNKTKKRSLKR